MKNHTSELKLENLKLDSSRKVRRAFKDVWKQLGQIGLNFLNIIPKLGRVVYKFFADLFTDLFHGIYKQQIEPQKAKRVIIGIASVAIITTIAFSGVNYLSDDKVAKKQEIKNESKKIETKKEAKKPELKKEKKKAEIKKQEVKKTETKTKEKK